MLRVKSVLAIALAVFVFVGVFRPTAVVADQKTHTRIELQASMQRFIDRNLIDGIFASFDLQTGSVVKLIPSKVHSRILVGDGIYVLCSDMRDAAGRSVPVDYYMVRVEHGYQVIRTEIANRDPLRAMMKSGKLKTL